MNLRYFKIIILFALNCQLSNAQSLSDKERIETQLIRISEFKSRGYLYEALGEGFILEKSIISLYGKQNLYYAQCLFQIAELLYSIENDTKALDYYLKANSAYCELFKEKTAENQTTLFKIAKLYEKMGKFSSSETYFNEVLKVGNEMRWTSNPEMRISILNCLGRFAKYFGRNEQSEKFFMEAITLDPENQELFSNKTPEMLLKYAKTYFKNNKYHEALILLNEGKELVLKNFSEQKVLYGNILLEIGIVNTTIGEFDKAYKNLNETEKIFNSREINGDLNLLQAKANLNYVTGKYEESEKNYLELVSKLKSMVGRKNRTSYFINLKKLFGLYLELGQIEKAEKIYFSNDSENDGNYSIDHSEYADYRINVAKLLTHYGEYTKAISEVNEALVLYYRHLGVNHKKYILGKIELGKIYRKQNDLNRAISIFETNLNLLISLLGSNYIENAFIYNELAQCYLKQNNLKKADLYFNKSMQILDSQKEATPLLKLSNCVGFSDYYFKKGDYLNCIKNLELSKIIINDFQNIDESIYQISDRLLNAYLAGNQLKKAQNLFLGKYLTERQNLINYFKSNIEYRREKMLNQKSSFFDLGYRLLKSFPTDSMKTWAYNHTLLIKALKLKASTNLKMVGDTANFEYKKIYENYSKKKEEYRKLTESTGVQFSITLAKKLGIGLGEIEPLKREIESLESALMERPEFIKSFDEIVNIDWKDLQEKMNEQEALIECININDRSGSQYSVLIIKKNLQSPMIVDLCSEEKLKKILANFGENLNSIYRGVTLESNNGFNGDSLYNFIWKPLEGLLKDVNKIYFSGIGLINRISLGAIPYQQTNEILGAKKQLHQLLSTRDFLNYTSKIYLNKNSNISLFGGIDYDTEANSNKPKQFFDSFIDTTEITQEGRLLLNHLKKSIESTTFSKLPFLDGTKTEVQEIAKQFNSAQLFLGKLATEEEFKMLSKSAPEILHIATHGYYFKMDSITVSKNILSSLFSPNQSTTSLSDNPLMRTGLAFAGANYAWTGNEIIENKEDGLVNGVEISNMNFLKTKLVVLSACETGLGDINSSEGVLGLQNAFKLSGVKKLIVSLWKVPDLETKEFMITFYKKLIASNEDLYEGFRNTQLEMSKKYPNDPYKWAGFVLIE